MSWRIVIVSNRCKLDLKMNYLVIRSDDVVRIHLSEISQVIVESTAVSLTAALLSELIKRKIKIVFCDEKRNPSSELLPYYGSHDTSKKVRDQISWTEENKKRIWTNIVYEKILNQMVLLDYLNKPEYSILHGYLNDLEFGDLSNREGLAAKVYFISLFGKDFNRDSDCVTNAALNYGYSILLSAFNREIVSNGYITQLGIFHDNMFNPFNLSSDLMEPFRPLVDKLVYESDLETFGTEEKYKLVDLLNSEVIIENSRQLLSNAIKIYAKSVLDAICQGNPSLIKVYRNEL